jgi:hypothetical protein
MQWFTPSLAGAPNERLFRGMGIDWEMDINGACDLCCAEDPAEG